MSINTIAIARSLESAIAKGMMADAVVRERWMDIVSRTPELKDNAAAIKAGLVLPTAKRNAPVPAQKEATIVEHVFVDSKSNIKHTRGCGVIYLLTEACKPDLSRAKAWSLVDRALKYVPGIVIADVTTLYRSGDVVEYVTKALPAFKAIIAEEYASCECREHRAEVTLGGRTCKHCHSHRVVSNGVKRVKCRDCGKTAAK